MGLIDKSAIVAEIQRRISILEDNSLGIFGILASNVLAKEYRDILSFIDTLEVKEVKEEPVSKDLKKEVDSQMDLLCNLLCYMDELSNGDSEGVYPLPINVKEDLQRFAEHFFKLGLKAKKGE